MSLRPICFVAAAMLLALPAGAQESGRYSLERGEDGFVRLDTMTGEMSLCRETGDGLSCDTARDDAAELRRERDRLHDENRELARENEQLRDELARYDDFSTEGLPSEEEIEEVATWFERVLVIMARTMRNAEEQIDEELEGGGEGR